MKTIFYVLTAAFALNADAGPERSVLASYSNFYQGEKDAFATCLIVDGPTSLIYINDVLPNYVKSISVPPAKLAKLKAELKKLLPGKNAATDPVPPAKLAKLKAELKKLLPSKNAVTVDVLPKARDNATSMIGNRIADSYPGYSKLDLQSPMAEVIRSICGMEAKN